MSWCTDDNKSTCEFQENLDYLRENAFFSSLPLENLKLFAYLFLRQLYQQGDLLFSQSEDDGQAFSIISGTAERIRTDGDRSRVLGEYGPGDFIGGLALLGKTPRLFSLQAKTDLICLVLTREKFSRVAAQFPELLPKAVQALVNRIHDWEARLLNQPAADPGIFGVSLL